MSVPIRLEVLSTRTRPGSTIVHLPWVGRLSEYDTNGEPGVQFDEVLDAIQEFNTGGDTTPAPDDTTFDDVLEVIDAFGSN